MTEEKKEMTMWTARTIDEFLGILGEKIDLAAFEEAKKKLVIPTMYGDVSLTTYDALVSTKLFQYFQYGVAYRVGKMMKSQDPNIDGNDIKIVLLEMARLEIEYGLRPITHVLPVGGSTYIKADGYLFYGKRSGKLRSMKYEENEEKDSWTTRCVIETSDGIYDGITTESSNGNRMSDPREKARTKSMRRALRKAFPIGAGDEPLGGDVEEIPHLSQDPKPVSDLSELVKALEEKPRETKPVDDISKLAEHPKTEEIQDGKPVAEENNKTDDKPKNDMSKVKELYKVLETREDKALLTHDIKFKYGVKSLAMLTEAQAQEILDNLATKV